MVLAAADQAGAHVIATYDVHQLEAIEGSTAGSGYSVSADNVADSGAESRQHFRTALLERCFPVSYHVFARKRDPTAEEQTAMDDHLLYVLGAESHADARQRVLERFGSVAGVHERDPLVPAFHLSYTRECSRYHAFKELIKTSNQSNPADSNSASVQVIRQGAEVLAGRYHRLQSEKGQERVIHKSHLYTLSTVTGASVTVRSAFDGGESLPAIKLPLPVAELLFDPPGGSTVHAVQGRTVHGVLVVHEVAHPRTTKQWLYTAVSRGSGAGNVLLLQTSSPPAVA
jgi:hypothetical protein